MKQRKDYRRKKQKDGIWMKERQREKKEGNIENKKIYENKRNIEKCESRNDDK